jgi:hypothetical protein
MIIRRSIIAALLLLALAWAPFCHGAVSPHHHWRTLRSGNFIVIYHEGEASIAARALAIAARVATKLDRRFTWAPLEPVRIVLADNVETSNGFTTTFPNNLIQIYLTPPNGINGLQRFDGWLRYVITHEYTHIIQLSMAHGAPATLRRVFGRNLLLFPGDFQPTLFLEGLAVYEESDPALAIGRAGSPFFDMQMRAEARAGLKPWGEVAMIGVTHWPAGNIPYLYGSYFYQFLAQRYGKKALPKLVNNYSNHLIPFRIGSALRQTTGLSRKQLWGRFEKYLKRRLRAPPYPPGAQLTRGKRLTRFGFDTQSVRAAPDGRVFFVRDDHRRHPALMVWRAGKGTRELAPVFTPAAIDFNPKAGILVARPEVCREYNAWFDLYRVNPQTGNTQRLTHCGRYRYAAWSPDGSEIAAVRIKLGVSSLVLLNAHGKKLETLWVGRNGAVLGPIDWSPKGGKIVAAMWRPVRGWALEVFDIAGRSWHTLLGDAGVVGEPQYTPAGGAVLFTSNAGGVYNLRRLALADGKVTTLTHVVTGAFSPSVARAGGPIFYLGYTARGYDLFELPPDKRLSEPLKPQAQPPLPAPATAPKPTPASHPYSPWSSLAPRYWMPELAAGPGFVQLGAATSGSDALGLHNYSADINVEPVHHLVGGSLFYQYADRFSAGIARDFRFDTDGNSLARIRRQDWAQAVYAWPFSSLEQTVTPMIGAARDDEKDVVVHKGAGAPAYDETVAGVALDWNTAHVWPISISPNDGQNLLLVAETSRPFGSDYNGNAYRIDWHGYIRLGGESVLALHYREGYATAGARPFKLGGPLGAGLLTPTQGEVFNHRDFPFRGYPSGLVALTGRRLRQATIAARIPLIHPERAWHAIGLHQMSLRAFVEAGAAWDGGGEPPRYYKSIGVETLFKLNLLYILNFALKIGVAHGFAAIGTNQLYLRLSLPL